MSKDRDKLGIPPVISNVTTKQWLWQVLRNVKAQVYSKVAGIPT